MGLKVLTEQSLSTTAVEALSTQFRVIGANTLASLESFDVLSNGSDNANSLVAWSNKYGISKTVKEFETRLHEPGMRGN
jgi:hypothetical protein